MRLDGKVAEVTGAGPGNRRGKIALRFAREGARVVIAEWNERIGQAAVTGPAGILMTAQGFAVSVAGVADFYHDSLDLLVVDSEDAPAAEELRKTGIRVHCTPTIMGKNEDRIALARSVPDAAMQLLSARAVVERA